MQSDSDAVWIVHMGRPGGSVVGDSLHRAESLQQNGFVALGWPNMKDLSSWRADRDAFRERVRSAYGEDASAQSVGAVAGILYRFVHEMNVGDIVVTPSPTSNLVRLGRVVGPYVYDEVKDHEYPSLRPTDWIHELSRGQLTEPARRSLKGRMSVYRAQSGASDLRRLV